jgi:hypothetical protein
MTHLAPHPDTPETDVDVLFQEAHQRRRRRRMGFAVVVVVAAGAAAGIFALANPQNSSQHPARAAGPPPPAATKFGPAPLMAWVDYQRDVHIGSLRTHQQRVISSNGGGPTTPLVVSGETIFWVAPGAMGSDVIAYDTGSGRVRSFAPGTQVFKSVGSSDVFVDDGNNSTVARYRLDGTLVKRFTLPDGWYLLGDEERGNAAPAVAHGGILIQSQPGFPTQTSGSNPPTVAVWTPANGNVRTLGVVSTVAVTFTDEPGGTTLVAWLPVSCRSVNDCPLQLTDLTTGATREIRSPLGYGFADGGVFSPDGRQLAVFAKTNPGFTDPETRLALVDVATGSLRLVADATLAVGESIAWAQWVPHSGRLIAGGLQTNKFLVDSTTLRSTPFSFLRDGYVDVNYSAVVLP